MVTRDGGLHTVCVRSELALATKLTSAIILTKESQNPKAVWEVSLERMAITLCPPRFDFLTDHWASIHP